MAHRVHFSLGSNLGDRSANLRAAIDRLAEAGTVSAVSSVYETEPVDVTNQPWFLNCVITLETDMPPAALLEFALSVEETMGRWRRGEKEARKIDIDILLFGNRIIDDPAVKIPHPSMHRRRFVLAPLVEIAPDAFHPVLKKTVRDLLAELPPGQAVRRLVREHAITER